MAGGDADMVLEVAKAIMGTVKGFASIISSTECVSGKPFPRCRGITC